MTKHGLYLLTIVSQALPDVVLRHRVIVIVVFMCIVQYFITTTQNKDYCLWCHTHTHTVMHLLLNEGQMTQVLVLDFVVPL